MKRSIQVLMMLLLLLQLVVSKKYYSKYDSKYHQKNKHQSGYISKLKLAYNSQYNSHANSQYNSHANSQYQSEANSQYNSEANSQYQSEANSQYNSEANSQYQSEANSQYQSEANSQYQSEANSQYNSGLNLQQKSSQKSRHKNRIKNRQRLKNKQKNRLKVKLGMLMAWKSKAMNYLRHESMLSLRIQSMNLLQVRIKELKSQNKNKQKSKISDYNGLIVAKELKRTTDTYDLVYKDQVNIIETQPEVTGGKLSEELDKRSANDDTEGESNTGYDPKLFNDDIPDETFNVSGELFMIDHVTSRPKTEIELRKVFVTINPTKISIGETRDITKQMDVIYMSNVFPRKDQITDILRKESQPTADKIDILRIPLFNVKNLILGGTDLYCFTLMNTNDQSDNSVSSFQSSYGLMVDDGFVSQVLQKVTNDKPDNRNEVQNNYYRYLTLCDTREQIVKKYLVFLNKLLVESMVTYIGIETKKYSNTQSQSWRKSRLKTAEQVQDEAVDKEYSDLQNQQNKIQELEKQTEMAKNSEEVNQLQAKLQELSETMTRQENMQSTQISQQMMQMNSMESDIINKEDQARCLEEALEIRKEEENQVVVKMLQDEELKSVSKVVDEAKSKMVEEMNKRMMVLQKRLDYQKQAMADEKSGVDNMMKNIIEQEMRTGDVQICLATRFFTDSMIDDKEKVRTMVQNSKDEIEKFISTGCSYILKNKVQAFRTDQNGQNDLLQQLSMCTKPEYFCEKCCEAQFGDEQFDKLMSCNSQCSFYMDKLKEPSLQITIPVQHVIDENTQNQFQKITEERTKVIINGSKK